MRAFLESRAAHGAAGNTVLYFGCRSAKADLFYADEWEQLRKQGAKVEVAASRDQSEKIYVQDLIKRDAALITEWLYDRRGHVYISGSAFLSTLCVPVQGLTSAGLRTICQRKSERRLLGAFLMKALEACR